MHFKKLVRYHYLNWYQVCANCNVLYMITNYN